jgi:hypothetical protein
MALALGPIRKAIFLSSAKDGLVVTGITKTLLANSFRGLIEMINPGRRFGSSGNAINQISPLRGKR